jgi:PKD repeat protein
MLAKLFKQAVCITILVLFLSIIFPVGAGSGLESEMKYFGEPIQGESVACLEYSPILNFDPEAPTRLYMVETASGEKMLLDVPSDLDSRAIEDFIEEELERQPEFIEKPIVEPPKEEIIEAEEETGPSEPVEVTLHLGYDYRNYLYDYLFCDVGETILFNPIFRLSHYNILKYEWDFDGDGEYDLESAISEVSHAYENLGIYEMKVKVTYSYNYTYYDYRSDYVIWGEHSGVSMPTRVSIEESQEYEMTIGVGSEKTGYPPILDLDVSAEEEDSYPYYPYAKSFPVFSYPYIRLTIDSQGKYISTQDENPSVIMRKVNNQAIIPYISDCEVRFNASQTKDMNNGSKFFWDFGDGNYGQGVDPIHTYVSKGTYTATLYIDDWSHSVSKTFILLRGSEDHRLALIRNGYSSHNYMQVDLHETITLDISNSVDPTNFRWCEWDFDGDGIFEFNTTRLAIHRTFSEAGYYTVAFRYTYSYQSYTNPWGMVAIPSISIDYQNATLTTYYSTQTLWIKIAVSNENGENPPIPVFSTQSSRGNGIGIQFPVLFWDNSINLNLGPTEIVRKNTTYLTSFYSVAEFIYPWNNEVHFNATTVNYEDESDLVFTWDFGDGNTSVGSLVTHTYDVWPGTYNVTLTVQSGEFTTSVMKIIRPNRSPNIYLYRERPGFDSITVKVDGTVVKTIPEVPMGSEISWNDVWISDGKLYYENEEYDFLYYEEEITPRPSPFGWILERDKNGKFYLNDEPYTRAQLKVFFTKELEKAGLFENEIEDFIEEMLGEDGRLCPGNYAFRYAIMYVPETTVEDIISIETQKEYDEIIRVHFLIQPAGENLKLLPPEYPQHERGKNILHEWGFYLDETIRSDSRENIQTNLLMGNPVYQTDKIWLEVANLVNPTDNVSIGTSGQSFIETKRK